MNIQNTMLVIMDGIGHNSTPAGNAVYVANMKNLKKIINEGASTLIDASGEAVGLINGVSGNSEVGHNVLGSGQIIKQSLNLLNEQIKTQEIFNMPTFKKLVENAKKDNHKFNMIILLSDGNTHSNIDHLFAFLKKVKEIAPEVLISIHALLDGRDVSPQSAYKYIKQTNDFIQKNKINAFISTASGRNTILMDRYESDTTKVTLGFKTIVEGYGIKTKNIETELNKYYKNTPNATDENAPCYILNSNGLINNGDSVLLLNYRVDRAIETCAMFDYGKYISEEDYKKINNCLFAGILLYDAEKNCPLNYISVPQKIENTLTEYLSKNKIKQYTVAETQKYGHVTYYFNGNFPDSFDKNYEDYEEIQSDKVIFSQKPKMKAEKITKACLNAIKSNNYQFIKCNFANGDMVGHTGNFKATIIACKTVDKCLKKIYNCCKKNKFNLIVTADHGNADIMIDKNNNIVSSHTINPVWFSAINFNGKPFELNKGSFGLSNVTASIAKSLNIEPNKKWNKSIIK